jgi:hypothetical protein
MNSITGKAEMRLDKYGNKEVLWEAEKAHILF